MATTNFQFYPNLAFLIILECLFQPSDLSFTYDITLLFLRAFQKGRLGPYSSESEDDITKEN
ncbi:hypothetical protein C2G38_2156173 [Gigaspora rosea]|uniref:Uncharacterized protein n=1 Tax=Gigaspora rosea TaxID=44941 RepID=A0A397W4Y8_9GLOM|nr:hypothetical protein C2G38_2156173 [Gigaspora rosea]